MWFSQPPYYLFELFALDGFICLTHLGWLLWPLALELGRGSLTLGRPSPSPFDKTNCALDYDSPPGLCRDPLLPLGEGWAVGRFPGQFLRRTELIKRSLRLDDEPEWWCREPPQSVAACAAEVDNARASGKSVAYQTRIQQTSGVPGYSLFFAPSPAVRDT